MRKAYIWLSVWTFFKVFDFITFISLKCQPSPLPNPQVWVRERRRLTFQLLLATFTFLRHFDSLFIGSDDFLRLWKNHSRWLPVVNNKK